MVVCGLLAFSPVQSARGHGDVHLQIASLNLKIRKNPTAALHLKCGELHQLHGDIPLAMADFRRAEELDPKLEAIHLARGRALLEEKSHALALVELDRLLESEPDHPEGRLCRARTLAALGRPAEALIDYDHLIAIMAMPLPDCFLERSTTLVALGRRRDAVRGLDEGIARLGNLMVLQQAALEIESGDQRYDEALARVDRVMPTLHRKEFWLERRGDILAAAGRPLDAKAAYAGALSSIRSLPAQHRSALPTRELEARLLARLGASPSISQANLTQP